MPDKYTPRRPLRDDHPEGYQESDQDYLLNNTGVAIACIELVKTLADNKQAFGRGLPHWHKAAKTILKG